MRLVIKVTAGRNIRTLQEAVEAIQKSIRAQERTIDDSNMLGKIRDSKGEVVGEWEVWS